MKPLSHWSSAQLSTLRLALALTVSVLIAFIGGWPGAFIMPVFVCVLLSAGGPPIPIKNGLVLLFMVAILLLIGLFIAEVFVPHPVVCLLLVSWLLLVGQYWLLNAFVGGLFFSIALAVFMCWFAHALIADPRLVANAKPAPAPPPREETYRQAMIKTLLVLPLLFVFYELKLTSDLLVLVFVALLIQVPSVEIGLKGSIGTLVANGLGGLAAVICYQLLVLAPSPVTLGLAIFIVSLLFGKRIFSGSKTAQLYGTGLNTVVVLLGGTTGAFGDGAATDMWVRLVQIGAACLYIIAALSLAENWLKTNDASDRETAEA
jgi:hypothetical protein